MPSLPCMGLMVSPGESFCTRKALMPLYPLERSSVAKTTMVDATEALVMNILLPLRKKVPSRSVAVVWSAAASEPPLGSVSANAATASPDARGVSSRSFCSSVPNRAMQAAPRARWASQLTLVEASPRATSSAAMDTCR